MKPCVTCDIIVMGRNPWETLSQVRRSEARSPDLLSD